MQIGSKTLDCEIILTRCDMSAMDKRKGKLETAFAQVYFWREKWIAAGQIQWPVLEAWFSCQKYIATVKQLCFWTAPRWPKSLWTPSFRVLEMSFISILLIVVDPSCLNPGPNWFSTQEKNSAELWTICVSFAKALVQCNCSQQDLLLEYIAQKTSDDERVVINETCQSLCLQVSGEFCPMFDKHLQMKKTGAIFLFFSVRKRVNCYEPLVNSKLKQKEPGTH